MTWLRECSEPGLIEWRSVGYRVPCAKVQHYLTSVHARRPAFGRSEVWWYGHFSYSMLLGHSMRDGAASACLLFSLLAVMLCTHSTQCPFAVSIRKRARNECCVLVCAFWLGQRPFSGEASGFALFGGDLIFEARINVEQLLLLLYARHRP